MPRKNVKFKLKFKFKLFIYFMQNILQVDWAADSLEPIMADQSSYTICLKLPFGLFKLIRLPGLDKALDAFSVHKYSCHDDGKRKLSSENTIHLP